MDDTEDHPNDTTPAELRQRADALVELATRIERSPVMGLPTAADTAGWHSRRSDLCRVLLERNLHQLHVAAEQLRQTAFQLYGRADQLDAAVGSAA